MSEEVQTKRCTKCGEVKALSEFCLRRRSIRNQCKSCEALYHKQWQKENYETVKAQIRAWSRFKRLTDPVWVMKRRTQARNWSLKVKEFLLASYVRGNIRKQYNIDIQDITPEMVALERESMILNRLIRQKKKEVA